MAWTILGWIFAKSYLAQSRVQFYICSCYTLSCEYGNAWCLKIDQWMFVFSLTRLWFSPLRCVVQTVQTVWTFLDSKARRITLPGLLWLFLQIERHHRFHMSNLWVNELWSGEFWELRMCVCGVKALARSVALILVLSQSFRKITLVNYATSPLLLNRINHGPCP
jgi:hypothetical protein